MKHIHILGICGTFMGGVALLARQLGYQVSGSDANVYPPMSTQLEAQAITLYDGYDPAQLVPAPDLVVIGNALSRGNPAVEYVLDRGLPYISGPAFLAEYILHDRWVLAVSGTHGKTTTSSMLAWILEYAGLSPGFLIGGVPANFGISARLTETPFFVVEADEYDSAFFDKRSKFIHYRPRTLILNNLEYDHADIFPDLASIKRQFHHLLRTVPQSGLIISPRGDANLDAVIAEGCWTPVEYFSDDADSDDPTGWSAREISPDGGSFSVYQNNQWIENLAWSLSGRHNIRNALAAIAAAHHAGVLAGDAVRALAEFKGVKRRMEIRAVVNGVTVYDDFAHHPTAIATTLDGLRKQVRQGRIIAILEPRSNTMRMGVHRDTLAPSLTVADEVILYQPAGLQWQLEDVVSGLGAHCRLYRDIQQIVDYVSAHVDSGDHVVIMSNGAFEGIHEKLIEALKER